MIVTAFLVAVLTMNLPTLTGMGIATFNQPVASFKSQAIRGGLLAVVIMVIASLMQVTLLQAVAPLLALAGVYGVLSLEAKIASSEMAFDMFTLIALGGAITILSYYASTTSPTTLAFYAGVVGMVVTYLLTLASLQVLQRRLQTANVPSMMQNVPLLAVTLSIIAIILSGFSAIF